MIEEQTQERVKRKFNKMVDNPMLEDYSLRYAPRSFRKWSEYACASAALGGIAYLVDFAIGASITVAYGFTSATLAILLAAVTIFLTGIPISYYSAKYNIDMDLLTRGAGFGYLGSTITSLIYASFTFIFFALEASVMAQALTLFFGMPLTLAYLICALAIIPLVIFGMTLLSKLQMWTQPIWFVLIFAPFIALAIVEPGAYAQWTNFAGQESGTAGFNLLGFGLAAGVALSLIAQIGEQVDYLRFMPEKTPENRFKWWAAVLAAGPGWVILGALKQMGGAILAVFIFAEAGAGGAVEPIEQFVRSFGLFIPSEFWALALATFLVILSQVKINVTNAYSGSLSWSNFFSRIFHWHPGRVVWVVFNVGIALGLMLGGVFGFLNFILGFYSNVAIAWIGAVVADLVINKPFLKVSPSYVEFKRAHLYQVNPVGFVSMIAGSAISIPAFFGVFGEYAQAFSPYLALTIAFVLSPVLALLTKGKYYVAREGSSSEFLEDSDERYRLRACVQCGQEYETPEMSYCTFHSGDICTLCCTLDRSCHDACKKPESNGEAPPVYMLGGEIKRKQ
jgi:purine-cytosine permease-like protein